MLGKIRKDGIMSIESDIDAQGESALFASHPLITADHYVVDFICDYLRLMEGISTSFKSKI